MVVLDLLWSIGRSMAEMVVVMLENYSVLGWGMYQFQKG